MRTMPFVLMIALALAGCPDSHAPSNSRDRQAPTPNQNPPPNSGAANSSPANPGNSILRIAQADVSGVQGSSPRLLADLTIAPNIGRPITRLAINGYLRTNDKTATGRLVISVDGTRVGSLSLDLIPVNADPDSFSLEVDNFGSIDTNGARVTVTLESDHGTGDTVQLEILYIESNLGADAKSSAAKGLAPLKRPTAQAVNKTRIPGTTRACAF